MQQTEEMRGGMAAERSSREQKWQCCSRVMQQAEEMIGGTGADRCSRQRKCMAALQQSDAADRGNARGHCSRAMQ